MGKEKSCFLGPYLEKSQFCISFFMGCEEHVCICKGFVGGMGDSGQRREESLHQSLKQLHQIVLLTASKLLHRKRFVMEEVLVPFGA